MVPASAGAASGCCTVPATGASTGATGGATEMTVGTSSGSVTTGATEGATTAGATTEGATTEGTTTAGATETGGETEGDGWALPACDEIGGAPGFGFGPDEGATITPSPEPLPPGNDTSPMCLTAARTSLLTPPDAIPEGLRRDLDPIFRHFLPPLKGDA